MAEVAIPPGGARRFARPLFASDVVGRSLKLWITSLPQLLLVAAIVCLPFFVARWFLHDQPGWKAKVDQSLRITETFVATWIGQAFAVRFIFQRLRREPIDLARSIAVGTRRIATVVGIALLLILPQIVYLLAALSFLAGLADARDPQDAMGIKFVLEGFACFVLLMIVVLVYPVAAPAAVVEGSGVFASLRRSADLTKGRRWTICVVTFIYFLIRFVPQMLLSVEIVTMRAGAAQFLASIAFELVFASCSCVLPIVLYHDLRETKEGFGIEDLASVFD